MGKKGKIYSCLKNNLKFKSKSTKTERIYLIPKLMFQFCCADLYLGHSNRTLSKNL